MNLEGFILGLGNSGTCMATCAPILIPYLLGEKKGVLPNFKLTGGFLLGRLLGYLVFAVLAWTIGNAIFHEYGQKSVAVGLFYILFSSLFIGYGFFNNTQKGCSRACKPSGGLKILDSRQQLLPITAGLLTGLSFCPPFLLATTCAASQSSLAGAVWYFFSFFLGTSLVFVLAPFVGFFKGFVPLQEVGKMAAGIMGCYYFYSGIILIIGGITV